MAKKYLILQSSWYMGKKCEIIINLFVRLKHMHPSSFF